MSLPQSTLTRSTPVILDPMVHCSPYQRGIAWPRLRTLVASETCLPPQTSNGGHVQRTCPHHWHHHLLQSLAVPQRVTGSGCVAFRHWELA